MTHEKIRFFSGQISINKHNISDVLCGLTSGAVATTGPEAVYVHCFFKEITIRRLQYLIVTTDRY